MSQNNNYNSVSCLYDLLDLQQSGTWSSDGTIVLQRPPASSKLDKIKFRSFSANIKNSLQGLQVPTITGRLTANVQLIGQTTVGMESGLYDDGIRDTLLETEQPTLTITNQYGITNFTPNKSNMVNSNFILEEFAAPITTSFADSINTIIEQGKYEFKKILGIIDPNSFDETEMANAQASAFQTMNYDGSSASGYINTNPNFNQYGYYLGNVQQYVTYVLYDNINNIQPSYNNYIGAYLLGTGDVQEANFNAMYGPDYNFRAAQLNTTDITVEPTILSDNSKTIFDNIIVNAGYDATRNIYDSFNGVVLDCGIYESFNNYVLLECDIATNVNRSGYFKLSYIIDNISRLKFISNGEMSNNHNFGSIDWSKANNLTTLLTQFFNNFVQHFTGINTEQTYIYSFKFYPIVRQDTFHTISFMIFCINPTTNTYYTTNAIFNVDELGYNGYFDNEGEAGYGSVWNIQEINAPEDYYVITISDNESFFTTLTDQYYSTGTIVGANWFYDAFDSDGYIYALHWKHTLNKNCFYVVVPYTDSNGHYNEHNFRILFRHNYHQESDSWLEYVENTSNYWPAIFIRGFHYEGNFIYICNDAVNERYKIFAGKNETAGFNPDSAGLEEDIFYNVSNTILKTEMQDIQANGTLLSSVDISEAINTNPNRVRNQVFIETTIWNDDTELSYTTNSDENYHCVWAKGGYYARCWERNPVTPSQHQYNYVFCNSAVKLTFGANNTYTPWTPASIVEKDESTGTYKWSQAELQHITNYTNRPYIYGIANENTFCDKIFSIDDRGYITCPVLALYRASDSPQSPYCANIVFSLDIFTDPEVLEFNLFGKQYPLNLRDVNSTENFYYNTSYQVYENRPSFNIARYSFDDNIFIQNKEYYDTLSSFLLLNNTDMTLKLICDAYPTLNNIVFYLNETSMIDFKESTTSPTEPNIKCRIIDAAGDVLTPEAASTIYSNITICVDWQFFN